MQRQPIKQKELLETATLKLIDLLPDHSDLVFSASFYLPQCIEERARAKKYYKQAFRKIIKKAGLERLIQS